MSGEVTAPALCTQEQRKWALAAATIHAHTLERHRTAGDRAKRTAVAGLVTATLLGTALALSSRRSEATGARPSPPFLPLPTPPTPRLAHTPCTTLCINFGVSHVVGSVHGASVACWILGSFPDIALPTGTASGET